MVENRGSHAVFQRSRLIFPGGVNSPIRSLSAVDRTPFVVSSSSGPYLFDLEGNRYIDYVLSWGALPLGHSNEEVRAAIESQLQKGISYGAHCELENLLAEKILALMPTLEMIRFVNSRTEATLSVVQLARKFTERKRILRFAGCYHGHLDNFLPRAGSGVATLGIGRAESSPKDAADHSLTAQYNDLESVRAIFREFPEEVAAVIVEPVLGNSGLISPLPGFLQGLREITTEYESLLIFDETACGFRAALNGAQGLYGVRPDLTTLGKVIGGGLPIGAYAGRREIMLLAAPTGPVYQAGALAGNPLVMAAGLATLEHWSRPGTFEESSAVATTLAGAIREIAGEHSLPMSTEVVGTMFGFFFQPGPVRDSEQAQRSDAEQFKRFYQYMLSQGVYFAPSQYEAGFVSSAHRGEALDLTLSKIREAFKRM